MFTNADSTLWPEVNVGGDTKGIAHCVRQEGRDSWRSSNRLPLLRYISMSVSRLGNIQLKLIDVLTLVTFWRT